MQPDPSLDLSGNACTLRSLSRGFSFLNEQVWFDSPELIDNLISREGVIPTREGKCQQQEHKQREKNIDELDLCDFELFEPVPLISDHESIAELSSQALSACDDSFVW